MKFKVFSALLLCSVSASALAQDPLPGPAETPVVNPPAEALPTDSSSIPSDKIAKLTAKEANRPSRKANWSVGIDVRQMSVTPDDRRYKQREAAPDINIGFVWIEDSWWAKGGMHLPLGPNSQRYPDSPPLDNEGYGVSAIFGKSLSGSLRKDSGDYGLELGVESFELSARSFRRQVLNDGSATDSWIVKTRWVAITPAIFATFLRPARPQGNAPEWLMTRIEGYRIALGVVVPVQKSWDLRYKQGDSFRGDRGSWKGFHGLFSVNAWLGI